MPLSSAARLVAAAIVVCTLLPPDTRSASAQTFANQLAVRVYDFSAMDRPVRATALNEARAIVADAGVMATWEDCTRRDACAPEPGDLVIRVVREIGSGALDPRKALGYSVVDSVAGAGTLATIYINRVEDSSRHAGASLSLLLGRAIAHEVGHLILRTNEHSNQGLMRAIWTEQEMARNAHEDWVFASSERRQLRAALQRTGRSAAR